MFLCIRTSIYRRWHCQQSKREREVLINRNMCHVRNNVYRRKSKHWYHRKLMGFEGRRKSHYVFGLRNIVKTGWLIFFFKIVLSLLIVFDYDVNVIGVKHLVVVKFLSDVWHFLFSWKMEKMYEWRLSDGNIRGLKEVVDTFKFDINE